MKPRLPSTRLKGVVTSTACGAEANNEKPARIFIKRDAEKASTRSILQCSPFFSVLLALRDPRVEPFVLGLAMATTVAPNGETGVVQELVG